MCVYVGVYGCVCIGKMVIGLYSMLYVQSHLAIITGNGLEFSSQKCTLS